MRRLVYGLTVQASCALDTARRLIEPPPRSQERQRSVIIENDDDLGYFEVADARCPAFVPTNW